MARGLLRAKTLVSLFALLITVGMVFPVLGQRGGLISNDERAYPGYTLLGPISSTMTYLIDISGEVVHTWDSDATAGNAVYLLENGHLLRTENLVPSGERRFGRGGEVVWEFTHSNHEHRSHHDVTVLPNGNVLLIAWEVRSYEQAVAAGRNPSLLKDGELWPDHIIEVDKMTDEIVWEWYVWDHLIQDFDPAKRNFGTIADHPELIDVNYILPRGSAGGAADWNHINGIAYNEALDQIVLSVHEFDEIWIIDHSTTTQEAAGHRGGRCGSGGDLLYRWGNPQAYRAGTQRNHILFGQHDAHWIKQGYPGEGHILVFDNGMGRSGEGFSTVLEMVPPVAGDGTYAHRLGSTYPPRSPVWVSRASPPSEFFSSNISGAQRLANGNTLICSGAGGRLFEVTPEGEIVWEYINPFVTQTPDGPRNEVFKVRRYALDYPGLVDLGNPLLRPAESCQTYYPV